MANYNTYLHVRSSRYLLDLCLFVCSGSFLSSIFRLMEFTTNLHTMMSEGSIVYIEVLQVIIFKNYCISFFEDCFGLSKQGVSGLQRINTVMVLANY